MRQTTEHIKILIISAQKVDNVIPTQDWVNFCAGVLPGRSNKNTGNIRIYCPRVFRVRSGPNQ